MDADTCDISMGPVLSRVVEANLVEAGAFFEGKGALESMNDDVVVARIGKAITEAASKKTTARFL